MELESKIEGLLVYKGEEMTAWELAQLLEVPPQQIDTALINLEKSLENRGLVLMRKEDSVLLSINKELSPVIESMRKDEITKDLSKASLETLSIILYKNNSPSGQISGVNRSEIDYIRGVNSSFILRNLLIRGLIEKSTDEHDSRRLLYKPTFEMLSYMGVTKISDLPDFENIRNQLEKVINQNQTEQNA